MTILMRLEPDQALAGSAGHYGREKQEWLRFVPAALALIPTGMRDPAWEQVFYSHFQSVMALWKEELGWCIRNAHPYLLLHPVVITGLTNLPSL